MRPARHQRLSTLSIYVTYPTRSFCKRAVESPRVVLGQLLRRRYDTWSPLVAAGRLPNSSVPSPLRRPVRVTVLPLRSNLCPECSLQTGR
ncbi:hypothetical protein LY78DRAFT_651441 [Colletotrichum sublineola]|nr:hypothetical protein LY78DRAFT_651441 [Colletotrichum sublineola]